MDIKTIGLIALLVYLATRRTGSSSVETEDPQGEFLSSTGTKQAPLLAEDFFPAGQDNVQNAFDPVRPIKTIDPVYGGGGYQQPYYNEPDLQPIPGTKIKTIQTIGCNKGNLGRIRTW